MCFSGLLRHRLPFHLRASGILSTISLGLLTAQVPVELEQRIQKIQNAILPPVITKGKPPATTKLADRMAALHVPGVSVAVIHDGKIEWARGFGVTRVGGPAVTPDTLFQAASISKPVTAVAVLRLAESGKLNLDADVNQYLKTWKVPANTFTERTKVTLRELLTHTAGMTVHGFPGYAFDSALPTLVQVLNGEKPANTPAILVDTIPGTNWRYSGGGFVVTQLLLEDVTGQPFPKLMHDIVLGPMGMTRSTYEQPLPQSRMAEAAMPYRQDGQAVPGGPHVYPEMAPAGLWTTPSDLARYAMEVQKALAGKSGAVLSAAMAREMLKPGMNGWGLGVGTGGSAEHPYFTHGGANEGFKCNLVAYNNGDGAVIMTNGDSGGALATEILGTIAYEYKWPDFAPREIAEWKGTVDQKVLARYVGTYELMAGADMLITLEGTQLSEKLGEQPTFPIFPESETMFFLKVVDAQIEFVKDASGAVTALVLHQGGRDQKAPRISDKAEASGPLPNSPQTEARSQARVQLNKGVQAFKSALYPAAVECFKTAVELDPTLDTAQLYLAFAYMQQYIPGAESPENMQMATAAYDQFQKVLAQDPKNELAVASIASLLFNEKKLDDANEWNLKLISLNPKSKEAYYTLGVIAWTKAFVSDGEARAKLGMKPEDPGPLKDKKVRTEVAAKNGPIVDAGIKYLDRSLQIDPEYDDAMAYENLLYRQKADLEDSPEAYRADIEAADNFFARTLETRKVKAERNAQPNTQVGASSPTCVEEATARSPNVATQTVDIRITNQRSNASKIYWLNQQGQRVFYMTLDSGAFYTQPTYSEHPWVATDNDGHCTMFFVATTAPHQEVTIRSPDGKIEGLLLGQPATTSRIRVEANVQAPNLIRKSHPYTKFGPDRWPKDELNHYIAMQNGFDSEARKRIEPERSAVASKAMIAGTSEPLAIHAGLDVLRHGGNAADAALTTSLAQIALTAGAAVSYAGIMTVVYYDAATGKVHTLNASYNTVQNEKDPLSIPGIGEHSGRTVLVPGYMAGVQALHDRFGRLPFSMLFGPAIWIAENGVVVSPTVNAWISSQKTFVTRLPETKRIFTKPDGELYKTGDLFRQLELAATLKKIAAQGSTYIYKGEWAHHFVDIAQREGGKITLEDLAAYRPLWTEPLQASYADYQVVLLGPPNTGGFITLGGLGLAEVAGLKKSGHYTTSAEALYNLIQIERTTQAFASASPSTRQEWFPEVEPSLESLLTRKAAERFWAGIQRKMVPPPAEDPSPHHSAGIVAVDEQGNVACILHSINGILWGATGIFVDGISIPDSAVFQQRPILDAGPGMRLPESTNPLIVLKGGKPVLASVAIGSGLHNVTLENLINILDFGMDPQTAVNQPNTQGPFRGVMANAPGKPEYEKEAIGQGEFPQSVIDGVVARGQAIKLVHKYAQPGYWIGIQVDLLTHKLRGAGTPLLPALVEGY
jgi:gamma-glutamyltranspeptidase